MIRGEGKGFNQGLKELAEVRGGRGEPSLCKIAGRKKKKKASAIRFTPCC